MRDLMASLTRIVLTRLRRDERGVVAAIVAIFLGTGVLLGIGALVIDVGQIYQERGELQNGADAAALAVAKSCALGACAPGVAGQLADGNASSLTGGTAGVPLVCGSGSLGGCPASTGSFADCPPPPAGADFVDVYTATQTASGSTLLPPAFATSLLGASYKGTTVHACAQAEWGAPAAATTSAIAISACEWDQATQQGTAYATAPPAASVDQVLTPDPGNDNGCPTDPAPADGAGTFGWADDVKNTCAVPVSGASFPGSPGNSTEPACLAVLQNSWQNEVPILVPIYTTLDSAANTYALQGFAEFVVTGYNLPSVQEPDWLDSANTCTNTCITGYFVQGVVPSTGSFAGTYLGASVIDLTG